MGCFNGKEEVEQYICTLPIQSAFVSPGSFMVSSHTNMVPQPLGDGTYALFNFVKPETQIPILDTAGDSEKRVVAILEDPGKYEGKILHRATAPYTMQDIVDAVCKATSKKVVEKHMLLYTWRGFLPESMEDHTIETFLHMQDYGYYGEDTAGKLTRSVKQARGRLTILDKYLQNVPLTLPGP